MRILLLSQWYPPEPQKAISDVAESLRDYGHDVTVLTGFPNYPSGNIYPGYRIKIVQKETIRGIPVIRIPLFPDHSRSGVKRTLNLLSFAGMAALFGPWLTPKIDAIYVIHPPLTMGLPARVLSLLRNVPFIYEIQDMWPETLRATEMVNSQWILDMIGSYAKRVYRRAAAIRVISPGFRDNLIAKGVAAEKIHCIPNWVDTDFYHPVPYDQDIAERFKLHGRFNVMFAGVMGRAQGLEIVLEAARLLEDMPDVQFVMVGDGTDHASLKQSTKENNLKNVVFLGRHPESAMSKILSTADVLMVHLRNEPLFRITIPHKIYTYMSVGKPVLAAMAGDSADTVESARAGVTCPPENPAALAAAVRRLRIMPENEKNAMGRNGREAACLTFNRNVMTRKINAMLKNIVTHKKQGIKHATVY